MLSSITLVLLFQVAGELVARLFGLPVPGPVLGMVFMLFAFLLKDDLIDSVRPTAGVLLAHLSLLFVPAGVGIMRHVDRFLTEGVAIAVTIVLSTILAMLATAWTILWVQKRMHLSDED